MWATSVPILVFLGLSVLELGPMYATDRRQTDRRQTKASLNASALRGRRYNNTARRTLMQETTTNTFGFCLIGLFLEMTSD